MADDTTELAEEVRQFTGYTDSGTIGDQHLVSIIEVAKEEIRAELKDPSFTFFQTSPVNTHSADRALFWFTCIGVKVRLGELGNISLTIEGLESASPNEETYEFWLGRFSKHMSAAATQFAENSGAASEPIERDDRDYSFDQPEL